MRVMVLAGLAVISLSACASTPKVQAQYYLPKASSQIQITQTLACDAAKTIVSAHSASVTTTYAADRSKEPVVFQFSDVSGSWANGDSTFTYTDDGRLKGVNSSTTGKGEDIINAAIKLGSIAFSLAGVGAVPGVAPPPTPCEIIATHGGGKPVTLTYAGPLNYGTTPPPIPDPASSALYGRLVAAGAQMPQFSVTVTPSGVVREGAYYAAWKDRTWDKNEPAPAEDGVVPLKLSGHKVYTASVSTGQEVLWSGEILVPEGTFALPIPKATFFGKQSFGLALSESGTITSIGYGTESGAASGLNSLSAIGTAIHGPDDATKAAAAKGSADLIVQQNRLVACRANPATCV